MSGGSSEQTVGYRYYMGIHMGICAGPVDAVTAIKCGDRAAWTGSATVSTTISIDQPALFGGEEREGGVQGSVSVMMGEATQGADAYLTSRQGSPQPGYRGLLSLVFRGGLISCNNPYIKPWAVKVRRVLKGWQNDATAWYSAKASITLSNGDVGMNPAHIIYECLTNVDWGMGGSTAQIDDAEFRAAADQFYTEGMGLCMIWNRQDTIQGFITLVLQHCGAVLVQSPTTGLFMLRAIRGDYDANTLPTFDPSNIISLDGFERPSAAETTNEVQVVYSDLSAGQKASIAVQNLANIQSQGGVVSTVKQYPGIGTSDLATRIAMRDLTAVSTTLARGKLRVNRQAYQLLPGDVFKLDWPKMGISGMVMRVLSVNGGTLTNGQITLDVAEDVFGLPATTYSQQQPSGWQDPSTYPAPAANRVVMEAGYYDLVQSMTSTELAGQAADVGYLQTIASRPSSDSTNYKILTRYGASGAFTQTGYGDFAPTGTLTAALTPTATSATIQNMVDVDLVTAGGWAIISGTEIVRVDSVNATTGAITIGRGVLDTVAASHALGARIFFAKGYAASDNIERVDADNVNVRLLPSTGRGTLAEGSAPIDSVVFDQRQYRPYPPGQLRVNTLAYPDEIVDPTSIVISWAHRNRLQQNLEGDESGNIGPEGGTLYSGKVTRTSDGVVITQTSGLAGTSWSPAVVESGTHTVEVWSNRSGLESRQRAKHTFTLTIANIPAWNKKWGKKWGYNTPLSKIATFTVGGGIYAGGIARITLGGVNFDITEAGGDTFTTLAASLAAAIDANATYSATASGDTLTVTGALREDYSIATDFILASNTVAATVTMTQAPTTLLPQITDVTFNRSVGGNIVPSITIGTITYREPNEATNNDSLTALAAAISTNTIEFPSTNYQGYFFRPYAGATLTLSQVYYPYARKLTSTDNGATWAQSGNGWLLPSGVQSSSHADIAPTGEIKIGTKAFNFITSTAGGWNQVVIQDGDAVPVATPEQVASKYQTYPRLANDTGVMVHFAATSIDGAKIYCAGIALSATQYEGHVPTPTTDGKLRLYETTDGLVASDLGLLTKDPADTAFDADSAFSFASWTNFRTMIRNNGRWFIEPVGGAREVLYTDATVPRTGWRSAGVKAALNYVGANSFGWHPLVFIGNTVLVASVKYFNDFPRVVISTNNGSSWTGTSFDMSGSEYVYSAYRIGTTFFLWCSSYESTPAKFLITVNSATPTLFTRHLNVEPVPGKQIASYPQQVNDTTVIYTIQDTGEVYYTNDGFTFTQSTIPSESQLQNPVATASFNVAQNKITITANSVNTSQEITGQSVGGDSTTIGWTIDQEAQ